MSIRQMGLLVNAMINKELDDRISKCSPGERVLCPCGISFFPKDKSTHIKTKKHRDECVYS